MTIVLKNSEVPGKVPLPTDLELGEMALNSADGKAFMKLNDGSVKELSGSSSVTSGWVRPSEWLPMPNIVETDQKVAILMAIFPDSNFLSFTIQGAFTVDWGDGTAPVNYATGTTIQKQFDYSLVPGSVTSFGYKQILIQITPQSGQNLTSLNFNQRNTTTGLQNGYSSQFLDIIIAGQSIAGVTMSSSTASVKHSMCERFKLFKNNITSFGSYMCANMYNLKSVDIWTNLITNFSYFFQYCYNLETIPLLDTSKGTNFLNMFQYCSELKEIPLLNTSNGTNLNGMFGSCFSLKTIPLLDTSKNTDFGNMFQYCSALEEIPMLNTSSGTNFGSNTNSGMFSGCTSLSTIPLINTANGITFYGIFQGCSSLQNIPALNTSKGTNFSFFVSAASSLKSFPMIDTSKGTSLSSLTNMYSLQSMPALDLSQMTGAVNFTGCPQLARISCFGMKNTFTVASCKLSGTALNEIYGNLATTTGQTITVSTNWGIATDDPTIATGRGWTVTGS